MSRTRIAIAATFTAEPILEALELWGHELSLDLDVVIAPYNQVFQQLLDPESPLSRNHRGLNVLLVRLEDWDREGAPTGDQPVGRPRAPGATIWRGRCEAAAVASGTPHLVCFCPPSPAVAADGRGAGYERAAEAVAAGLQGWAGCRWSPRRPCPRSIPWRTTTTPTATGWGTSLTRRRSSPPWGRSSRAGCMRSSRCRARSSSRTAIRPCGPASPARTGRWA